MCDVPYPPFSGGAAQCQTVFRHDLARLPTYEDSSSHRVVDCFGILTWLFILLKL